MQIFVPLLSLPCVWFLLAVALPAQELEVLDNHRQSIACRRRFCPPTGHTLEFGSSDQQRPFGLLALAYRKLMIRRVCVEGDAIQNVTFLGAIVRSYSGD